MSDPVPPSIEIQVENLRRTAAGLSDHQLDEHLAVAVAKRDVAAAHKLHAAAAAWQELALALDDVRRARTQHAREIEELTGPPPLVWRPLTAEELAESTFPDEQPDPPC